MALLASGAGIYAAGLGGVARFTPDEVWIALLRGLPLRAVTTLAQGSGVLLAGGDGGIARSVDGGQTWRRCAIPASTATAAAFVVSPSFDETGTALAGTLGSGILRSTDGGQSWETANFGLGSQEVLALAWLGGEAVIAATADGLSQSPNGGRAWRAIPATAGKPFVALSAGREGEIFAAPEHGLPWRTSGDPVRWEPLGFLAQEIQISALAALADGGLLLGTAHHGLLRSEDGGATWADVFPSSVLCFAVDGARVYAGIETGILVSEDDGQTWRDLPLPPLHDLRQLQIVRGAPLLSGRGSPPVRFDPDNGWTAYPAIPSPLIGFFVVPDGSMFASSPDGLFFSRDRCATWTASLPGQEGAVSKMTFGTKKRIWAGLNGDGALLRSEDDGTSWQRLSSPFGVLPLIALQFVPAMAGQSEELLAVTYDERQQAAAIWRSRDGGTEWSRGANVSTPWPLALSGDHPPFLTVGNTITVRQPNGDWQQSSVTDGGLRQVASRGRAILALGIDTFWRSDNCGTTWSEADLELPLDEVLDMALDGETLYALLSSGRLWSRRL